MVRLGRLVYSCFAVLSGVAMAAPPLAPQQVLLLYNSQNASSAAVAAAYQAAHTGVVAFDLNDPALNVGSLSRTDYLARLRDPVRRFINGVDSSGMPVGPDLSGQIIVIATTIGLPARVLSPSGLSDEFTLESAWASVESELTLLQQDLEAPGSGPFAFRYSGFIDNPYHARLDAPITGFSRASVKTQRPFTAVFITGSATQAVWSIDGLTPGDMYLVCRLDAAATPGGSSALDNTLALIQRSQSLTLNRCAAAALLDEFAAAPPPVGFEFDEGDVPPLIDRPPDFEDAAFYLQTFGVSAVLDETSNFVTGPELPAPLTPLVTLGTYGENHDVNGWGEDPPGSGSYLQTYTFAPAAVFIAYESWGGTSLYAPGTQRGGQAQALDFIAMGGSFTIATVMEPFEFAIANLRFLLPNLLTHGLTFAEAAYSSIPALSWQSTPIGDPLARVVIVSGPTPTDRNGDGRLTVEDLYTNFGMPADHNCDSAVNAADGHAFQHVLRAHERIDIVPLTAER